MGRPRLWSAARLGTSPEHGNAQLATKCGLRVCTLRSLLRFTLRQTSLKNCLSSSGTNGIFLKLRAFARICESRNLGSHGAHDTCRTKTGYDVSSSAARTAMGNANCGNDAFVQAFRWTSPNVDRIRAEFGEIRSKSQNNNGRKKRTKSNCPFRTKPPRLAKAWRDAGTTGPHIDGTRDT